MTVYGDLDVSVIDTLPPGRKPIKTWLFSIGQRRRAYQVLREELTAGHQAYIVYPLVEESEKVDLQAAIQASERLQTTEFSQYRVGLLHGRMKTDEKERTMAAFKAGEIQILVATTVIEVGVDVQNATVMLIEHAERFGLAQLHQLRGRVGRGTILSYCLLVTAGHPREGSKQSTAQQRLEALVSSTDGFHLAEEDLRIRGPGEFFGVRQWGLPEFRAADLIRDRVLLEQARSEAFAWVQRDPYLAAPSSQAMREERCCGDGKSVLSWARSVKAKSVIRHLSRLHGIRTTPHTRSEGRSGKTTLWHRLCRASSVRRNRTAAAAPGIAKVGRSNRRSLRRNRGACDRFIRTWDGDRTDSSGSGYRAGNRTGCVAESRPIEGDIRYG